MALRNIFFPSWHRSAPAPAPVPASAELVEYRAAPAVRIWIERLVRVAMTLGLLVCAGDVARRGVAEWFYDRQTFVGMRRAVRWCPESARYRAALADALDNSALQGDVREVVRLSEEATQLAPLDARGWARLGAAYEAGGRTTDAGHAYEMAVLLFPRSPEMNWGLGNFLLRQGNTPRALGAFHKVVIGSPAMRRAVYQTAWGASDNSREILDAMIPPRPEILFDYLHYLLETRRLDAAREVWWRLLDGGFSVSQQEALRYLDTFLAGQRSEEAIAAWDALAARAPNLYATHHPDDHGADDHGGDGKQGAANRVTNGGFEFDVLNGGLDWRITPVEGVAARVISGEALEGARCLEVAFAGTHNLEFSHVFELVPVEPATRYLFTARVRAREISSDIGPRFLLRDSGDERRPRAETSAVLGTTNWVELRLEFRTSPETRLIDLRLVRPRSRKFDGRIGGTLWVDDVRVEALRPAARGAPR